MKEEYEFVIKKAKPETAKERFLNQVALKDSGWFAKSVYETVEKLNAFEGQGTVGQLAVAGLHESWLKESCHVCFDYHDKVISFDVNCGEYDFHICTDCLRGALDALQKA